MTKSRDPLTMAPLVCKNIVQLKFCCHTLDTQNLSHISDYDNKPKTLILYFVSKRITITDILFQTPLVSVTLLENPTLPVQQHISIKAILYRVPVPLPFAQCPPPTLPSCLLSKPRLFKSWNYHYWITITDILFQTPLVSVMLLENPTCDAAWKSYPPCAAAHFYKGHTI